MSTNARMDGWLANMRLFIFDADDTLRRTIVPGKPCPHRPGEWELLPGVAAVLRAIPWDPDGPFLGIASNQDQVAYGWLSAAMAQRLLRDMMHEAVGEIRPRPCIRFCPHALEVDCDCRKPAPGMLQSIMAHFGVGAGETVFVGNAETDREAAARAGVGFAWAWEFFEGNLPAVLRSNPVSSKQKESAMPFRDRIEAAHKLADRLVEYRGRNPLVLAIPRGAVPMAAVIAEALNGELDVVLVRKLGAPGNPEFAIGSVDESGRVTLNEVVQRYNISSAYIAEEVATQKEIMLRRRTAYTPIRPPIDPAGRTVIIVDDGIATGSTMISALESVRAKGPEKLIAATAVLPADTVRRLRNHADELVYLEAPMDFGAVGQFFRHFDQVADEEVIETLKQRGRGPGLA